MLAALRLISTIPLGVEFYAILGAKLVSVR
jgi:hypothetical protein